MIRFQTVGGRAILITAHLRDGSMVPFGASVYDAQGSEVGLAGQDGWHLSARNRRGRHLDGPLGRCAR